MIQSLFSIIYLLNVYLFKIFVFKINIFKENHFLRKSCVHNSVVHNLDYRLFNIFFNRTFKHFRYISTVYFRKFLSKHIQNSRLSFFLRFSG